MSKDTYYLDKDILVEPLVSGYHAYSLLVSPVLTCIALANRLKVLKSFIKMPHVHKLALENPNLRGGKYLDISEDNYEDVRNLIKKIESDENILKIVNDIQDLNNLLENEAIGLELQPLYEKIPESLKGYIELYYDLEHRANYRLIEWLTYKADFYNESLQSIALERIESDERSFIFNTPRFENAKNFILDIPFKSDKLDFLASMKSKPKTIEEISKTLNLSGDRLEKFKSFLTNSLEIKESFESPEFRIRYFGHACILIEHKSVSILLDPFISYSYESNLPRFTYEDLPEEIDYVLVTHNHQDHFVLESLLMLRHKVKNIVVPSANMELQDPSLKLILKALNFKNIISFEEFDTIEVGEIKITGFPFIGEHCDLSISSKITYHLDVSGHTILVAADTDYLDPRISERLQVIYGNIDYLFIGMETAGAPLTWGYGELFFKPVKPNIDQSRRANGTNSERALEMIKRLNIKHVYVYAMGLEPWLGHLLPILDHQNDQSNSHVEILLDKCNESQIYSKKLFATEEIYIGQNKEELV